MIKLNVDVGGLVNLGKMSSGYFVTTLINNAIPFLFLPILTRCLSPAEYANIALFGFFLLISNSLTGASISAVISKHFFDKPKEHIARIIGNSIIIVICFSLITMLIILIIYPYLKDVLDLSLFWLLIIPVISIFYIIFGINLNVLRNSKKAFVFSYYQIGNTLINVLISFVFVVVLLWGWQGRVWGIMLAFIISAVWSFYYLKKSGYVSFVVSKDLTKSILKVVVPLMPNSFQSVVISQVGIFFIQYFFTKELLGVYSVGFQIALVIKLLIDTLGLSWSPFLYQQLSNIKDVNKLYVMRLYYSIIGVVILGIVLINIFSGLILRIMTTSGFHGAAEFIPWFTLGILFHGMYVFLMPILIKHDKQKYISTVSFLNMVIMIGLNFGLIKLFGYIGVVYAYCLTYFIMFLAFAWQSQKVFPMPWLKALKIWN